MKDFHICLRMQGSANWMGGMLYIHNLARALANLPGNETEGIKLSIAIPTSQLPLVEDLQHWVDKIYLDSTIKKICWKISKVLADYCKFIPARIWNIRRYDIVYPDIAGVRAPYKWGGWIPDFQHCHLPEFFSAKEIDLRNKLFRKIAQGASFVILSSHNAQEDFCRLYPEAASKSEVLNFVSWVDPHWFTLDPLVTQKRYGLPDEFFLVSNQFWKHKNHLVILEALSLLRQKRIYPIVVCTGGLNDHRHPHYFIELTNKIEQHGLDNQIKILGFIPREDQIQLMRRCLAVIQPSLFEGWSTVVEDARILGKSILVSELPVHVEQNPPYANFFAPHDAELLALLLSRALLENRPGPCQGREQTAATDHAQRFSAFGRRFIHIIRTYFLR